LRRNRSFAGGDAPAAQAVVALADCPERSVGQHPICLPLGVSEGAGQPQEPGAGIVAHHFCGLGGILGDYAMSIALEQIRHRSDRGSVPININVTSVINRTNHNICTNVISHINVTNASIIGWRCFLW